MPDHDLPIVDLSLSGDAGGHAVGRVFGHAPETTGPAAVLGRGVFNRTDPT